MQKNRPGRIWRKRWLRSLGRRGATLLFFGLVDIIISWSLLSAPPVASNLLLLPPDVWAIAWAFTGAVSVTLAWVTAPKDAFAFALGAAVKVFWGTAYLYAFFHHDVYRAWVSTLIWWAFATHILITSGWAEPVYLGRKNGQDGGVKP